MPLLLVTAGLLAGVAFAGDVSAAASLVRLSADPFTNASSQHRTEVEPAVFGFGSTLVAAFQAGRFADGGASDIGWATSSDGGASWSSGFLSGLTVFQGSGPFQRASDPSVAFDARHGTWLIEALALQSGAVQGAAVVVSRSSNGLSWSPPVTVASGSLDKPWISCDNHPASPFYGHCYSEWDDVADAERVRMSISADGGASWAPSLTSSDGVTGVGGQPVVQPNGQVIVPLLASSNNAIRSFRSVDGGASWRASLQVATVSDHPVAGGLRSEPLPSAGVDGAGNVYVIWHDCRFRAGCSANDLVMATTSQAGYPTWSTVSRIPIDPTSSSADHFIPGLGVDPAGTGSNTHLALTYYYYPQSSCSSSTCQLDVGLITSSNGGSSWTTPSQLAGPISLSWLAQTTQGPMVGDYIATAYTGTTPHPIFANANPPTGTTLDEAIYTH
jgi:hypothetical protein